MKFKHFPAEVRSHSQRPYLRNLLSWYYFATPTHDAVNIIQYDVVNRARRGHTAVSDPGTFEPRPRNPPGMQAIQLILPPPRSAQSYILAAATSYAVLAIGGMTWHCIATDPEQVIINMPAQQCAVCVIPVIHGRSSRSDAAESGPCTLTPSGVMRHAPVLGRGIFRETLDCLANQLTNGIIMISPSL